MREKEGVRGGGRESSWQVDSESSIRRLEIGTKHKTLMCFKIKMGWRVRGWGGVGVEVGVGWRVGWCRLFKCIYEMCPSAEEQVHEEDPA